MPDNASDNNTAVSDATHPTTPPATPESQMIYEERRADFEAHINDLKEVIDETERFFETVQDKVSEMESRPDIDQPRAQRLKDQAAAMRTKISALSETHDALAKKFQRLIAEEDAELRKKLLDEMKQIMQEAERNNVALGNEDGEAM